MAISSLKFGGFSPNAARDQYQFMLGQRKEAIAKRELRDPATINARPIAKAPPLVQPLIAEQPTVKPKPVTKPPVIDRPIVQLPPVSGEGLRPVYAKPIIRLTVAKLANDPSTDLGRGFIGDAIVASNNPTRSDEEVKEFRLSRPPAIVPSNLDNAKLRFAEVPDTLDYVPVNELA
jgi:hypothetical protein